MKTATIDIAYWAGIYSTSHKSYLLHSKASSLRAVKKEAERNLKHFAMFHPDLEIHYSQVVTQTTKLTSISEFTELEKESILDLA